nr:MAG TPA: hypothetical protein [Caudoviricetes sp.]
MFLLKAQKNSLDCTVRELLTSGSQNVYLCQFDLSKDWDDLTAVAVFQSNNMTISVSLEGGECQVPWEVLQRGNEGQTVYAGVYGTDGKDIVLPTVWTALGKLLPGTVQGQNSVPATPSLADQFLAAVSGEREKAETAADRAENAAIHQPIIMGGTWWIWNADIEEYTDTGTTASGGGGGGDVSSSDIKAIRVMDKADYDALAVKDDKTLYLIRG